MLEENGMLHRYHEPTIPPQVTYTLTERAKELSGALDNLYEIAVRWYGTSSQIT